MDSYPCSTEVIATFHSLKVFSAVMDRYPNIVLIISGHTFFFNKKMAYSSFMSTFMAKTLNLIIKSAIFHFLCLKDSIFHLASAAFILLLNVVLISLTNLFQSWVSSSLSNSSSFL